MDGILPLWKPKGMTSHDCVMKIRRIFGTKKVGHTGTLDPEVEGVLPICIGKATKLVPYLVETKKTYIAECFLGKATETEDGYGEVTTEKPVVKQITDEEIEQALSKYLGDIYQVPPMYSAIKINGKKLYEYARKGETVERPRRKVTIYEIKRIIREKELNETFLFQVICSAGTYIRTLCVDLGEELGYPAHMSYLVRTATGDFSQKDTITFEALEQLKQTNQTDKLKETLVPMLEALSHMTQIEVEEDLKWRIVNGQKLPLFSSLIPSEPFVLTFENKLLAIYQIHPENQLEIKPIRVFSEEEM